jgi:GGDEF domain-containing protein
VGPDARCNRGANRVVTTEKLQREVACPLRDSVAPMTPSAAMARGIPDRAERLPYPDGANRGENIRHAIEERPVETATGPLAVSMSMGVAVRQDSNAEQLVKEADVALYRAKEGGRNREVLAKPSGLSEIRASKMTQHPDSAV